MKWRPGLYLAFALLISPVFQVFQGGTLETVLAQNTPNFSFNNFTGDYYLDKDAKNVSLLVTEETLIANFPTLGASFTGLKRALPLKYGGHGVDLTVASVSASDGTPIPYATYQDKDHLIIDIGDKDITVYGPQTYKIKYTSKGVVNFTPDSDELKLAVNGRGWQQTFAEAQGFIHLPDALDKALVAGPTCYIGFGERQLSACEVKKEAKSNEAIISVKASQRLEANQSLSLQLKFKKGTFDQYSPRTTAVWQKVGLGFAVILAGAVLIKALETVKNRLKKELKR